jgi:glycosyltransferase involved in cell wall biosynthesis
MKLVAMKAPSEENSIKPVLISIIVPAYKQARYLGETIRSVLNQTYSYFEIIVVDDASPDNTSEIVRGFDDSRIQYILHSENRGLSASRNTGIQASSGEILAFLDADDIFHPEKLQMHAAFLQTHQDIGVTYNARFELDYSRDTIRDLWRPPLTASLPDLVAGFPFSPSDMVVRRKWFSQVGLFDPGAGSAEDTDLPCRMALAGCKFASVDRALNYRRYHSGRGRKNLRGRFNDISRVLQAVFSDPRCSEDVLAIRNIAIKEHLMALMSLALIQEETALGQELVLELIRVDPSVLEGNPCELLVYLMAQSIADENRNHEALLQIIFAQLPKQIEWMSRYYVWAVAHGYLNKAIRAVIWGRLEDGKMYFERAQGFKAEIDDKMLQSLAHKLLSYEIEFGEIAARAVIKRLSPYLNQFGGFRCSRRMRGFYLVNRAFRCYGSEKYSEVPGSVLRALASDPSYFANRGVIAILLRSLGILRKKKLLRKS